MSLLPAACLPPARQSAACRHATRPSFPSAAPAVPPAHVQHAHRPCCGRRRWGLEPCCFRGKLLTQRLLLLLGLAAAACPGMRTCLNSPHPHLQPTLLHTPFLMPTSKALNKRKHCGLWPCRWMWWRCPPAPTTRQATLGPQRRPICCVKQASPRVRLAWCHAHCPALRRTRLPTLAAQAQPAAGCACSTAPQMAAGRAACSWRGVIHTQGHTCAGIPEWERGWHSCLLQTRLAHLVPSRGVRRRAACVRRQLRPVLEDPEPGLHSPDHWWVLRASCSAFSLCPALPPPLSCCAHLRREACCQRLRPPDRYNKSTPRGRRMHWQLQLPG